VDILELRRKAGCGSVVAQSVLGICHLYGREVEVDYTEARRLLSAAADKGSSRAMVNLARMHAEGLGVPRNLPKAIGLYEAVAKVEVRAQLELGRIYARGAGIPQNPKAALACYATVALREDGVEDSTTAAFVGAVTFEEIEEAKNYVTGAT